MFSDKHVRIFVLVKSILSLALSLSILFPAWINTSLLVHYRINKEYYAQNLCENQERPEMKCEGSCQLSKQLKQAENSQSKKEMRYVTAEWQLFLAAQRFEFSRALPIVEHQGYYLMSQTEFSNELLTPPPQLL